MPSVFRARAGRWRPQVTLIPWPVLGHHSLPTLCPFEGTQHRVLGLGSLKTDAFSPAPSNPTPPTRNWIPESTVSTLVSWPNLSSPYILKERGWWGGGWWWPAIFWGET